MKKKIIDVEVLNVIGTMLTRAVHPDVQYVQVNNVLNTLRNLEDLPEQEVSES